MAGAAMLAFSPADAQLGSLCGGTRYELGGGHGGAPPKIRLTVGGVEGPFLIDYGATQSSLSAAAFAGAEGSMRTVTLPLPGVGERPFALRSYAAASTRIGILGTDVLSRLTVQLAGDAAFVGADSCPPQALREAGFTPVSQAGFFAPDAASVDPSRANVPVVFIRIGDVRTWAQIDTGYADTVLPHSVDVNAALHDRLSESGVALEGLPVLRVTTCDGSESRKVYRTNGTPLGIESDDGTAIARMDSFHLVVNSPNDCGGIAGLATPAAQLGASFLDLFGAVVFDPKAGTVWVRGEAAGPKTR
jgi:hypothetical protein